MLIFYILSPYWKEMITPIKYIAVTKEKKESRIKTLIWIQENYIPHASKADYFAMEYHIEVELTICMNIV